MQNMQYVILCILSWRDWRYETRSIARVHMLRVELAMTIYSDVLTVTT